MFTCTQSPKVQQGPNLRAAIAELPKEARSPICRDNVEGKSVGEVAGAVNDRLVNDLPYIIEVMVAAAGNQSDAYVSDVQVGLMVISRDLGAELHRIGFLMNCMWRDENGMEDRS